MRILVCGGRDYGDKAKVHATLDAVTPRTEPDEHGNDLPSDVTIIHGGARGADMWADGWATANWCTVDLYRADWNAHGKGAGPIRNQRMIDEGKPDLVVAFPGGRGTADMVRRARAAGIEVIEVPS